MACGGRGFGHLLEIVLYGYSTSEGAVALVRHSVHRIYACKATVGESPWPAQLLIEREGLV